MRQFLAHLRARLERWLDLLPGSKSIPLPPEPPTAPAAYEPLERLRLADGVSRSLFTQYAEHRATERGAEETGWVLMGLRFKNEAVALAALPAGANREAGVAHVQFNAQAQALASRILRQTDRRLTILGIIHTHPGTLRHPSAGDLEGDTRWVKLLRGGEGVFAIGTADAPASPHTDLVAEQPKEHVQTYLRLRFSWYALARGENQYRPLPVLLTLGPDLAAPLHALWPIIEQHAERLDGLCRQLSQVRFEVLMENPPRLEVRLPVPGERWLVARLAPNEIEYGLWRGEKYERLAHRDEHPDHGLLTLLADLLEKEPHAPAASRATGEA